MTSNFAVGLEAANARSMARARVHYDERPPTRLDGYALRRHDAHEAIIDRALERAAVDDELRLVIEDIRHSLGHMLAVLIAALAQDVPKQNRALGCVDRIVHRRAAGADQVRRDVWLAGKRLLCAHLALQLL
jgi:hypothetical protein